MPFSTTENIEYEEMRAISNVLQAHVQELGDALRAMVVFGPLVATGSTQDIDLLEIVDGWQGPRRVAFRSTDELPLRGRLTLYILTPDEFENPTAAVLPNSDFSSLHLLRRVDDAYSVVYESSYRYIVETMNAFDTQNESPLTFFRSPVDLVAAR